MRAFLERRRSKSAGVGNTEEEATATTTTTPQVPKGWQGRVSKRLDQIALEQENERMTHHEDSEDSENSLLQANHQPFDDDDEIAEILLQGDAANPTIPLLSQPKQEQQQQGLPDEPSRLLRTIGSDLDDSATAYFEEDASFMSSSSDILAKSCSLVTSSPSAAATAAPKSLLGMEISREGGNESPRINNKIPQNVQVLADAKNHHPPTTKSMLHPPRTADPFLFRKFVVGAVMTILSVCLLAQSILFPAQYVIWLLTCGLSLYCATLLWPAAAPAQRGREDAAVDNNDDDWQVRRQELLAQGLPFKSRLVAAQATARRLQHRIKILKQLEKVNQQFRAIKQEETLTMTIQVLLKANKTPLTTHLNALSLSVLPTKLSTIGVKLNMPELLALAQSKRGSRYNLFQLFREVFADKSTIFDYPPLLPKTKASNKKKVSSPSKKSQSKRQVPPRLAEI